MKLTPAMKIILAVAAICIAITLITTNNIATVMVLYGLNTTPAVVQQGTVNQGGSAQQGGSVQQGGTVSGDTGNTGNTGTVTPTPDATQPSGGSTTTPTQPSGNSGSSSGSTTDDKKPADKNDASNAGDASKMSTQQIVDLYKKSINNAHSNAKTAVRVKDGAINYKGIVEAGGLSSAASTLMGMFMVADEASIEVKNEEWKKEEIPSKAGCNLTPAGVKSATCEEKNGKYIVTIVAKDAVNPKAGADGIGSVIDVIEEEQITGSISSVPGLTLSNISIAYENVTVVATIDKATGNMENLKINAPCVLSLGAKLAIISIDNAKVGIQVISEFAMTY